MYESTDVHKKQPKKGMWQSLKRMLHFSSGSSKSQGPPSPNPSAAASAVTTSSKRGKTSRFSFSGQWKVLKRSGLIDRGYFRSMTEQMKGRQFNKCNGFVKRPEA